MFCIKCKKEIVDGSIYCNFCGKKQSAAKKRKIRKRANGQGSIVKLSGNRSKPWLVLLPAKYDSDGKCKRQTYGCFQTKTEALNALNDALTKNNVEIINMTFSDVYESWSNIAFRELSISSIRSYKLSFKYLESLSNIKMRDIKSKQVQEIIDKIDKEQTAKKIRVLFSKMCKYAMSIDLIDKNYSQFLAMPKTEKKEKEIFSSEEILKINESAKTNDPAKIVMIMLYTGLRIGEILTIKQCDTFINTATPYMIGGIKTEAGKNRLIPINANVLEYVKYFYYYQGKTTEYLFTLNGKTKINVNAFRNRQYHNLLIDLNIAYKSPHSTRHTYLTKLHELGASEANIIKLAGHADFKITRENYIHQNINELSKTVNILNY